MVDLIRSIECGEQIEIIKSDGVQVMRNTRVISFLNAWCMLYGSTYEGRKKACAMHMGIKQKVPILISETTGDMLFPTQNVRSFSCVWINYRALDKEKGTAKESCLQFLDGYVCKLPCDIRTIRRELGICKEYLSILGNSPRLFHDIIDAK